MPTLTTLLTFSGATLILVLLPGPNLLFILGAGSSGGRRTALAAAVGVEVGTLVHVIAAALGISALLQSSAVAFSTVKYLGVAYLVYLPSPLPSDWPLSSATSVAARRFARVSSRLTEYNG